MSEVFDGYERQYWSYPLASPGSAAPPPSSPAQEREGKLMEIQSGLEECDTLIRKMDPEARSLQPSVTAMVLAKLREYKADLSKLKRDFKQVVSGGNPSQAAHEELLESGLAHPTVSGEQRDRLTMSVQRLDQSNDRIKESRRTMLETEELGASILEDLHKQRQTLLPAHNKLHGVDDAIDKSKRVLSSMLKRMSRNKMIVGLVIVALVVAILVIVYFKLLH